MAPPLFQRPRTLSLNALNTLSAAAATTLGRPTRMLVKKLSRSDLKVSRTNKAKRRPSSVPVGRQHSQPVHKSSSSSSSNARERSGLDIFDMDKSGHTPTRRLSRSAVNHRWGRFGSSSKHQQQPVLTAEPDDMTGTDVKVDKGKQKAADQDAVSLTDDVPLSTLRDQQQAAMSAAEGSTTSMATAAAAAAASTSTTPSLVPDSFPLNDRFDDWTPGVGASYRTKYILHNPKGPRWYRNVHLIPPQTIAPAANSTLSPPPGVASFDSLPAPIHHSRSHSVSPLPTPSSSQLHVADGPPGTRSRKISQTAHDNVDMLDSTDPWGTNWHHHSPYDSIPEPAVKASQDPQTRSRGSRTMSTGPGGSKATTPSPLSQSTSAVHLAEPSTSASSIPRSWSKGQVSGIKRFLSGSPSKDGHEAPDASQGPSAQLVSSPEKMLPEKSSPADVSGEGEPTPTPRRKLSKKRTHPPPALSASFSSSADPSTARFSSASMSHLPSERPQGKKYSSIFDRLGKKLSVLKRPLGDLRSPISPDKDRWVRNRKNSLLQDSSASKPMAPIPASMRPTLGAAHSGYFSNPPANNSSDSLSLLEAPYSIGRLTIANPDVSASEASSPVRNRFSRDGPDHSDWEHVSHPFPTKTNVRDVFDDDNATLEPPPKRHSIAGSSYAEASPKVDPKKLSVGIFSPFAVSLPPEAMASPMAIPPPLPEKPSKPFMFIDPVPLDSINSPTNTEGSLPIEQANLVSEIQSILSSSPAPVGPEQVFRLPNIPSAPSLSLMLPQLSNGQSSIESPTSRASLLANPPTPSVHGTDVTRVAEEAQKQADDDLPPPPPAKPSETVLANGRSGGSPPRSKTKEPSPKKEKESSSKSKSRHEGSETRHRREGADTYSRHGTPESRRYESGDSTKVRESRSRQDSGDGSKNKYEFPSTESKSKHSDGRARAEYYASRQDSSSSESKARHERHEHSHRYEDSKGRSSRKDRERERDRDRDRDRERDRERERDRDVTTAKFKLIRTASDKVHMLPDVTKVGEDYWQIVEADGSRKKESRDRERDREGRRERDRERDRDRERERERDRDRDSERERERRREKDREREKEKEKERERAREKERRREREKSDSDRDHRREPRRAETYESAGSRSDRDRRHYDSERSREERERVTVTRTSVDPSLRHKPSRTFDDHSGSGSSSKGAPLTPEKDRSSDRRRREDKHSKQTTPEHHRRTKTADTLAVPEQPVLARRSSTRRPISDLSDAADFATLSAREAWDAERLWKSKSAAESTLYPPMQREPSQYSDSSSHPSATAGSFRSFDGMHGSSHTSYLVQSPFQGQGSQHSAYYAVPVVYHVSPYGSPPPQHTSPGPYDYPNAYRSFADSVAFPSMDAQDSQTHLDNPLPEPPRQSLYSTASLNLHASKSQRSLADPDPSTPEYWARYAGITTH